MRPIKYRQPLIDMRTKDFKGFHYWGYEGTTFTAPAATGGYANTGNLSDEITPIKCTDGVFAYENDIVASVDIDGDCIYYEVRWFEEWNGWCLWNVTPESVEEITPYAELRIVGNIYETPEYMQ